MLAYSSSLSPSSDHGCGLPPEDSPSASARYARASSAVNGSLGSKVPCSFRNPQVLQEIFVRGDPRAVGRGSGHGPAPVASSAELVWGCAGCAPTCGSLSSAARAVRASGPRGRPPPAAPEGAVEVGRAGRARVGEDGRTAAHFARSRAAPPKYRIGPVAQRRRPAAGADVHAADAWRAARAARPPAPRCAPDACRWRACHRAEGPGRA